MFSSADTIWVLFGAVLVFFMQAGFSMLESGFTRAKNAGNIIMKTLMDFSIGTIMFWVIGFSLMFGASNFGIIGTPDLFVRGDYSSTIPTFAFLIFQTMFCATSATIVSGAMAERTKFTSYFIYSIVISAIIYPISGHWIWGGGWLSNLGFHDFAGSTAVHLVGGVGALIGAKILGARIGKYDKDGKPKAILGHSLTLGALGAIILWFCWFGFNGASTLSATGKSLETISSIFLTTNISATAAAFVTMIITWLRYKKPDVSMTLNGALAGLVAITAGCDLVSPVGALVIGIIAAFVVVFGIEFVDKILKIDDPVGAIGVHCFCGATGTILTGFLAVDKGLFYGGGFKFLGIQILGVIAVALWSGVIMTITFVTLKKTIGLRVSEEEEINGLDFEEHGILSSYGDFMPYSYNDFKVGSTPQQTGEESNIGSSVTSEITHMKNDKITKIVTIMNQSKFEILKTALMDIGITGITVTNALGYGMQKGHKEYYRGVEYDPLLLPKIKVEIVVCKVPVDLVIKTIKKTLCSGSIGDGKIFVYNVENVIKIRTGEEGYDALQDL